MFGDPLVTDVGVTFIVPHPLPTAIEQLTTGTVGLVPIPTAVPPGPRCVAVEKVAVPAVDGALTGFELVP